MCVVHLRANVDREGLLQIGCKFDAAVPPRTLAFCDLTATDSAQPPQSASMLFSHICVFL